MATIATSTTVPNASFFTTCSLFVRLCVAPLQHHRHAGEGRHPVPLVIPAKAEASIVPFPRLRAKVPVGRMGGTLRRSSQVPPSPGAACHHGALSHGWQLYPRAGEGKITCPF